MQRLLVDNREEWATRFTHPMSEALSIRELLALPGGSDKIVWASGDATLDTIGGVDWTNKMAFSLPVQPFHEALVKFVRDSLEDLPSSRSVSLPDKEVLPADEEEDQGVHGCPHRAVDSHCPCLSPKPKMERQGGALHGGQSSCRCVAQESSS